MVLYLQDKKINTVFPVPLYRESLKRCTIQKRGLFRRFVEAFICGCNEEVMYQRISSRSHAWFTFINMSINIGFARATVTNMAAKIATLMTQNNFVGGIMHASLSSVSKIDNLKHETLL